MSDPLHILRVSEVFGDLPEDELRAIAGMASVRRYDAGQPFIVEDEPGTSLVVIGAGEVEIVRGLNTPDERIIDENGPGALLGEMSYFVNDGLRTASVRGRTPVELVELPYQAFTTLLGARPRLAVEIVRMIAARLLQTDRITIDLLRQRNRQLAETLDALRAAQSELIAMETLEHELRLARRIQQQLLPAGAPDLPGWSLRAHWEPAAQVSGDFYDFIPSSNGGYAIVLGDVSGKGMPAALVMATTRAMIRAAAAEHSAPEEILSSVNQLLAPDMTPGTFVTCLIAHAEPDSGQLRIANAGQCLPYLRTPDATIPLKATGMPLGLLANSTYEPIETQVAHGEDVVIASDGLIEARLASGEFLGVDGVANILSRVPLTDSPIPPLLDAVAAGMRQDRDDLTIVQLSRL